MHLRTHARKLALAGAAAAVVATTLGPASAEEINGTKDGDELIGTTGYDVIRGYGGADEIDGAGGGDVLHGGPGADKVYSRENDEQALVDGGPGDDRVIGWRFDTVVGGSGNDKLYFWRQTPQGVANCGTGIDTLYVTQGSGRIVKIRNCERVKGLPPGEARRLMR